MMAIGNTEEKDKDDAVRNGAAVWYNDRLYIEDPTTVTMSYAIQVKKWRRDVSSRYGCSL